jgi:hypothetical protein
MNEQDIRNIIRQELAFLLAGDRFTFQKHLQIFDARNIQLGKGTGTQIGTEALQKIGFFGATPVVQLTAVANATGGVNADAEARATLNTLLSRLRTIGLIAT